jgi:acyl-CoA thioester hydrolase
MAIDYYTPLRSGDVMLSRLWIEREGPRFIFHQDIYKKDSGEPVVKAVVTIVCLEDGRINRGDELAERISHYLVKP